jgi:hypothetical protein
MFQWRNKKSEQWRTVRILNVEDKMEHSIFSTEEIVKK